MLVTKRGMRAWTVLAVLIVALTACSGEASTSTLSDTTDSTESGASTSTTESQPESGDSEDAGTFRVAVFTEPEHLNPGITSGPDPGMITRRTIFEGLLTTDRNVEPVGVLAESWDISDDGTQYTFHLREGVRWHDGEPFTSDDVVFSFEEVSPLHPSGAQLVSQISSIEAPDDHTVVLNLTEPFIPLLPSLISGNMVVLPRHIYGEGDITQNPANFEPIGTGPFKFDEWIPGSQILLVRNDDYWGKQPAISRLAYSVIPASITQVNAIINDEIDYIGRWHVDRTLVDQLIADPSVEVDGPVPAPPTQQMIWFNNANPPLDQPEVRKALFQAMDRENMVSSAFAGHATLMKSAIPELWDWAYDPTVDYNELYPYDPEAAASALDEAGVTPDASGTRLELDLLYSDGAAGSGAIAEVIRSNLADIGVVVNLVQREYNLMGQELYQNRNYDLATIGHASREDPALGIHRNYECVPEPSPQFNNPTGYCNEILDELFVQAKTATSNEARTPIYSEIQHIIAEDLPAVSMAEQDFFDVIRVGFEGTDEFFNTTEIFPNWSELSRG